MRVAVLCLGLETFAVATDDRPPAEIARGIVDRWRHL